MNITDKTAIRLCTSCQMCAAVCPKSAIRISLDKDGFYRPSVDDNLCVNCGICMRICYKFDKHIETSDTEILTNTKLYGATAKDINVVNNTTSGGVADIMARQLMKDGYRCVGVVYDGGNDTAIDKVATTEEDLTGFRGSKYIQSYTLDAFKEVVENCKTEKYAIFGTPCHIYALDKYLRQHKMREQHMLIDLYCHGCPSLNIWKKYVRDVKLKIGEEKIDYVNFRSKVKGWGKFCIVVIVGGKPVYYSERKNNDFFDIFFSDQILNEACNDCLLRGTLAYTDIRLGDFWGKRYVMNDKGVSAVSIVSESAKDLFEKITEKLNFKEENYEDFLPWQSWGKCHHPNEDLRKTLLAQLRDDKTSLRTSIVTIQNQQSVHRKFSRIAKHIIQSLPVRFEKRIRWIFYKIH